MNEEACLAHLDQSELHPALWAMKAEGRLDGRGVHFSEELLDIVLTELASRTEQGRLQAVDLELTQATFEAPVSFASLIFDGIVFCKDVVFKANANFNDTVFRRPVTFEGTRFEGDARFSRARFEDRAVIFGATFEEAADFDQADFATGVAFDRATFRFLASWVGVRFRGENSFLGARFEKLAKFEQARFEGSYSFHAATFVGQGRFDEAVFEGESRLAFHEVRFERMASFRRATVKRARSFGPMLVLGQLNLDEATFTEPFNIDVSAREISCRHARFSEGIHLRARWADILLDETDFASPSIVTRYPGFKGAYNASTTMDESRLASEVVKAPGRSDAPRVVSVRRANVAQLTLSDVDVRACRFWGAHNLDALRLEGGISFAKSPRSWRWTGRQVLAEEHEWRARHQEGRGWYPPETQPSSLVESPESLEPYQLAGLYRALRKGREDNKDEPGAADFYYGEMEMRRKVKAARDSMTGRRRTSRGEALVLFLYWLVSGYGLRSGRALVSLLGVIVAFAFLFHDRGFASPQSFIDSLLFSASSTTSLFKAPDKQLTPLGGFLQLALALIGPLLFGLMVLSLRGRIKR